MKIGIIVALAMMNAGLLSAEGVKLEGMNVNAVRAMGDNTKLARPVAVREDGGNNINRCLLFVENLGIVKGDSFRKIAFSLRTNTPGETVVEAGYTFIQGGAGQSEWKSQTASGSGSDTWVVNIAIPAKFNYSFADLAFYAKTAQGHIYWLNRDGVSGRNFRIDVPLFYEFEGYSQELTGENISTLQGPDSVRQFNPQGCDTVRK
ncbi:MAG: hypothetical protein NTY45_10145 [Elusimicrobia bacterium]|nr:hypothetical protein [Elusimicrobiota bacterium]